MFEEFRDLCWVQNNKERHKSTVSQVITFFQKPRQSNIINTDGRQTDRHNICIF